MNRYLKTIYNDLLMILKKAVSDQEDILKSALIRINRYETFMNRLKYKVAYLADSLESKFIIEAGIKNKLLKTILVYILSKNFGLVGIWYGIAIANLIASLITAVWFKLSKFKKIKNL